jgi:hypothetical protein
MEAAVKFTDNETIAETENRKKSGREGFSVHLMTDSGGSATTTLDILHLTPIALAK